MALRHNRGPPSRAKNGSAMRPFLVPLLLLALLPAFPTLLAAQPCTADSQCALPGMERRFMCQGTVLVSREKRCLGGRCTVGPETRIDCGGGVGFGNCDSSSGRCRAGPAGIPRGRGAVGPSGECPPRCICNGNRLIIVTGEPGVKKRCDTIERDCAGGCSCKGGPHCKGEDKTQ